MNLPRERLILIGVGALVALALIFGGVSMAQRSAYMEGYLMGRLSAPAAAVAGGAVQAAPVAPYPVAPYVVEYQGHGGPGPFGFLFLLLGLGAVFFVFRRMAMMRAWAMHSGYAGAPGAGGPGAGAQGWHHGPPPWAQERMRRCWEQGNAEAQAQQPATAPAQAGTAQPATPPASEPGATSTAER